MNGVNLIVSIYLFCLLYLIKYKIRKKEKSKKILIDKLLIKINITKNK